MYSRKIFALVVLFGLMAGLTACHSQSTSDLNTGTPEELLAFKGPLSVEVTIDGGQQVFYGSLNSDGSWTIPLNIELDVSHTFVTSWFTEMSERRLLLLAQSGSFFADSESRYAQVNGNNVSTGSFEFDIDCDNQSNLQEVIAETDPFVGSPGCDSGNQNPDSDPVGGSETPGPVVGTATPGSIPNLPEMVLIEAALENFSMGRPVGLDEGARVDDEVLHTVQFERDFYISAREITWDQYSYFAGLPGVIQNVPSDNGVGMGPRPVVNVLWADAVAYTQWLSEETGDNYRLPTEAEWEYAARGGTQTRFWTGDTITREDENYNSSDTYIGGVFSRPWGIPLPVGSLLSNQFGLYDMLGNVSEWTCSAYDPEYLNGVETRCVDGTPDTVVVRGANYLLGPSWARAATRIETSANYRDFQLGFRVVRQ